jgi:hypothetical protein
MSETKSAPSPTDNGPALNEITSKPISLLLLVVVAEIPPSALDDCREWKLVDRLDGWARCEAELEVCYVQSRRLLGRVTYGADGPALDIYCELR